MRMILAMLAAVGCSGDDGPPPDPHEEITCDAASWGAYPTCEAACEVMPDMTSPSCEARFGSLSITCSEGSFSWEGIRGCCIVLNASTPRFMECI